MHRPSRNTFPEFVSASPGEARVAAARDAAPSDHRAWVTWAGLAAVAALIVGLTWPSFAVRDFWWSDASRHALNGALILDYLSEWPLADPVKFASDYYLRYPAVTLGYNPPLFPAFEAAIYAVLGVSRQSAQIAVLIFWIAAAWSTYFLCRLWFDRLGALATAAFFAASPAFAFWGPQVMSDIPLLAFVILGSAVFLRQLDSPRRWSCYAAAPIYLAALYTKFTAVFTVVAIAWKTFVERGRDELRTRRFWVAAGLSLLGVLPAIWLSMGFAFFNLQQALEPGVGGGASVSRDSLANWLYYLRSVPVNVGWPGVVLALVGVGIWVFKPSVRSRFRHMDYMAVWWLSAYVLLSLVAAKEFRHGFPLILPTCVFAMLGLRAISPARAFAPAALALVLLQSTVALTKPGPPQPYGFSEAAELVAARADEGDTLMYVGGAHGAGSFIFRIRAEHEHKKLRVIRGDKVLFDIRSHYGSLEQRKLSPGELRRLMDGYAVKYVVFERNTPKFGELSNTKMLADLLRKEFVEVERIPAGFAPNARTEVVVYFNPDLGNAEPTMLLRYKIPLAGFEIQEQPPRKSR